LTLLLHFLKTIKPLFPKTKIMKNKLVICLGVFLFAIGLYSCRKELNIENPGFTNSVDTAGTLKAVTDIPVGVAVDYNPIIGDVRYLNLVKNEFDAVTFTYNMKHGSIVQDNGTLNFANADAMVNALGATEVFGHTLGWHENQNSTYLKNFARLVASTGPNQLPLGDFETGNATSNSGWYVYNSGNPSGTSTISVGSGVNEVRTGTRSMKIVNPIGYGGDQWRVQIASDLINTTPGEQYTFVYWVKAATAGGSIRLSTQNATNGGAQYQGDQTIGTTWQEIRWNITANSPQTRFFFDAGANANTYFIDDVSATGLVVANTDPVAIAKKLDTALNNYVTGMVNHFKTKVKSWDVINEILDNSGNIRNNANSPNANSANDYFVWSNYMGKNFALKAFQYAQAADPTATLYINDYGLESNSTKLDSMISLVAELKRLGAKVDGIGTQMHITATTKLDGIDAMMKKLGATGLKIRISELDVRVNIDGRNGYVLTPLEAYGQEQMYAYVVNSYRTNVPKAQQAGITVWGLTDNTSWLYNNGKDFPLLFNANYGKKSAYGAYLAALKKP
jgi:endo-1,4-beta-xylanase